MENKLSEVLDKIGNDFQEQISDESKFILEVDIGRRAGELGYLGVQEAYRNVNAVVPLKEALTGMKVLVDGRTFVNYARLESGIAVPDYVAKAAGLPHKTYEPNDSMIRNFV